MIIQYHAYCITAWYLVPLLDNLSFVGQRLPVLNDTSLVQRLLQIWHLAAGLCGRGFPQTLLDGMPVEICRSLENWFNAGTAWTNKLLALLQLFNGVYMLFLGGR